MIEEEKEEEIKEKISCGKYMIGDVIRYTVPGSSVKKKPHTWEEERYIKNPNPFDTIALCQVKSIVSYGGRLSYGLNTYQLISGSSKDAVPDWIYDSSSGIVIIDRPLLRYFKSLRKDLTEKNLPPEYIEAAHLPMPDEKVRLEFVKDHWPGVTEYTGPGTDFYLGRIEANKMISCHKIELDFLLTTKYIVSVYYEMNNSRRYTILGDMTLGTIASGMVAPGILAKSRVCRDCVYDCRGCELSYITDDTNE